MTVTQTVVAFDIGGTTVKSLTVTREEVLEVHRTPTRADAGPEAALEAVLHQIEDTVATASAAHEVVGVGVASPGLVDESRGMSVHSENLGWREVPLRDLVDERTGLPVGFGHDVRAGGLAEQHLGAGRGAADQAYLSLGTGIACALVLDGRAVLAGGYAGEVGHGGAAAYGSDGADGGERDGEPCACGGRGCPETYASAAAMVRRYRRISGEPVADAEELLARVHRGDRIARKVWKEAVDGLAQITGDIVRVTGAARVVVGGGLALAGDDLLTPLTEATRRRLTIHRSPEIVLAELAGVSGSWGTALLGWQAAGYALDEVASGYLDRGARALRQEAVR